MNRLKNNRKKILKVIHGYPPFYMAGSEVYSFNLCNELKNNNDIFIFTRIENPYAAPYTTSESEENGVSICRVNKPQRDYTFEDKYLDTKIDSIFKSYLSKVNPDIVHIGHLSHLSTGLVTVIKEAGIPIVFTVHDFWMGCFRGQFVKPDLSICDGCNVENCYTCAAHFFKNWISKGEIESYSTHMKKVLSYVDRFLIPSYTLIDFYKSIGIPEEKLVFSPYGFDKTRIHPPEKKPIKPSINFGFMGRIIPVKGIHLLLRAFKNTTGKATLSIHGGLGSDKVFLEEIKGRDTRIQFRGSYHNVDVEKILHSMDVLVVPSIWPENAPLVIQEAFLAGIPVITSNIGGMAELVENNVNGLTVPVNNEEELTKLLQSVIDEPEQLNRLSPLRSSIRDITDDAEFCEKLYDQLIAL